MIDVYPNTAAERDRWILSHRPARNMVDPRRPFAFKLEEERTETGEIVPVATIFLANRECPWRCLMCDLWRNTLTDPVPIGAIPAQIDSALSELHARGCESTADTTAVSGAHRFQYSGRGLRSAATPSRQVKLYNSGSFFDPRAIPLEDYAAIAERVRAFSRVIVECHPALVGGRCLRFRDLLAAGEQHHSSQPKLEVAMGLETAHPGVLEKLNKRMTLDDFQRAADYLRKNDIALRVFILVKPPFLAEGEALEWAHRSIDFAFDCGATVASLIPTRIGNGALEALAARGEFSPPKLASLETALDYGIGLRRGRVFADWWDLQQFSECSACFEARRRRLQEMNLNQVAMPAVDCDRCQSHGGRRHPV